MKSKLGYKKNSPYKTEPFIDIDSNSITMEGVEFPILAIPDNDKPVIMKPGENYLFPNSNKVREIPVGLQGGEFKNTKPVSPFMNLKPFIEKYKLKFGGVVNYLATLPSELQGQFIEEFESFDKDTRNEVEQFLKGGYYQTGGVANAELEDKETLVTPDGELSKIEGKTHAEGGEMVNIPDQTRIYSHYLKAPQEVIRQVLGKESKKKMSYADLSKKFPTKPYIDILEDPDSDKYQLTTAQVSLANNLAKLDTIFFAQETDKSRDSKNKFQQGGTFDDYMFGRTNAPARPDPTEYGKGLYSVPFTRTPTTSTNVAPTPLTFYRPMVEEEQLGAFPIPIPPEQIKDYELPEVVIKSRGKQPKSTTKSIAVKSDPVVPIVEDDQLWNVPTELSLLPQRNPAIKSLGTQESESVPSPEQVADVIVGSDDQNYPGRDKRKWNFKPGIGYELAGTIADIGLALSDKLRVSEPPLYDRRKYPLFTRFVDFDDKEVQRMYSKNIQQIQQSNIPEQVKQAQINAINAQYQDYQAKVDFGNLQRYEDKRERDTNKLQQYLDSNTDQRVADIDFYRQRKARVDDLRNAFKADRKVRVVNALKNYAEYADKISKLNEFNPNYKVNPITGRVDFREREQSDLNSNLLNTYSKRNQNRIDLGGGAVGQIVGGNLVVTDKDGKVTVSKLNEQ